MTKVQWLTAEQQDVWRAVISMNELLAVTLERELIQSAGLSLADYAVLVTLSEATDHTLQSRNLACALLWEKSRLSHQVKRMEKRGLVQRIACATDARAAMVRLTSEGLKTIRKAAPSHVATVRQILFEPLTAAEAQELGRISKIIFERIQANVGAAECDMLS